MAMKERPLVREADGDKLIIGIRAWKDRKD